MEKDLPSGAVLEGQALSYQEAWHVSQTILKELKQLEIDVSKIDLDKFQSFKATDKVDKAHLDFFMSLKDPLCSLLASSKVVEAVDKCFKKFTYNKVKITPTTFEERSARQDYLFAAYYVLWENVSPFFAGLSSSLKAN